DLQRPDPGALRQPRHHLRPQAAVRAQFHDRPRLPAGRAAGLCGRGEAAPVPGTGALLFLMIIIDRIEALRETVRNWRMDGERVGLVPTMGSLHDGHLSLLAAARQHADRVIATVFVNPLQFGPGEDFERYPRTPDDDLQLLEKEGCDLLFAPSVREIYPGGGNSDTRVSVVPLAGILCGKFRPGHFDGVATVV